MLTLYDYHLSADVFNMSREENQGFCGRGPCLGNGVLNISTCYMGMFSPSSFVKQEHDGTRLSASLSVSLGVWGFISSPHFFQADEKFRTDVHGMQPSPDKHEFIMSFDPVRTIHDTSCCHSFDFLVNERSVCSQRSIAAELLHA